MTLRRGAGIIGNALGDFFGVTEVSQRGNTAEGRLGWEQYSERRLEEVREGNGEREKYMLYSSFEFTTFIKQYYSYHLVEGA